MNCERVSPHLEAYVDGELAEHERARVEAHLAQCRGCAAEVRALEAEQALYAGYDRGFEPRQDAAWAAVLDRIAAEAVPARAASPGRPWLERIAELFTLPRLAPIAAAACAVAIAATVAVNMWRGAPSPDRAAVNPPSAESGTGGPSGLPPGEAPPPVETPAETKRPVAVPAPEVANGGKPAARPRPRREVRSTPASENTAPSEPALPGTVAAAEKQYLEAIAVLTRDVSSGATALDPELERTLDAPLREIDRNIAAARQAVQRNPEDPVAVQSMLAAYDEKVGVLEQMARYQVARDR